MPISFRDSSGSGANAPTHPTRAQITLTMKKIPDNDKTTAAASPAVAVSSIVVFFTKIISLIFCFENYNNEAAARI